MSRKPKYTVEQKIKACKEYLSGNKSAREIAKELIMAKHGRRIVIEWAKKYQTVGIDAFLHLEHNSYYKKNLN